jgi:hypothetical protein
MPNCAECGKSYVPSGVGRPQRFCSRLCYRRNYDRHPADDRNTSRNAICEICKKPFVKNKRHQVYCSRGCYEKAWPILNREAHNLAQRRKRLKQPELFRKRDQIYGQRHRTKLTTAYPWAYLFKSRKAEAKQKGLPFELDNEWAAPLWEQGCAITGLTFQANELRGPWPFSPSIDQIKPGLGYTKENSRFLLWGCNALKGAGTDEDMVFIAKAIAAKFP